MRSYKAIQNKKIQKTIVQNTKQMIAEILIAILLLRFAILLLRFKILKIVFID